MQASESSADVMVQRPMAIDDGDDHDVLRLEELLRAQSKRVQALETELRRRERLLRQLTTQLAAAGREQGAFEPLSANERSAWMKRAVEAEAARVDMMLRLDAVQGRLTFLESAAQDQVVLHKAVTDADAVATAVRFRALALERELRLLREERERIAADLAQRSTALSNAEEQLGKLRALVADAREQLQSAKRALTERERELRTEHQRALSDMSTGLREQHAEELQHVERRLVHAESKVSELGQALSEAKLQADAALAREDAAREELTAVRQQRASHAAQLAEAQAAASAGVAAAAELANLRKRLSDLEAELAEHHAANGASGEALRQEGEALRLEGEALRKELARREQQDSALREQLAAREQQLVEAQRTSASHAGRVTELEKAYGLVEAELEQSRGRLAELAEAAESGARASRDDTPNREAASVNGGTDTGALARQQLEVKLRGAHQLLKKLRDGLGELAVATAHGSTGGQVASGATLAGNSDGGGSIDELSSPQEHRLREIEGALEAERKGRSEDRRESRRQLHALKTECQVMRARFEDEQTRVHAAMVAVQALKQDLLPGDPLYSRIGEVLSALEGNS